MIWLSAFIAFVGSMLLVMMRNARVPGAVRVLVAVMAAGLAWIAYPRDPAPELTCEDAWSEMAVAWDEAASRADAAGETDLASEIRGTMMAVSVRPVADPEDARTRAHAFMDIGYRGEHERLAEQVRIARFTSHRVETNCVSR